MGIEKKDHNVSLAYTKKSSREGLIPVIECPVQAIQKRP